MSKIVFILGAGASKEAGAPLMYEFLDYAYELWKLNRVSSSNHEFSVVFDAIGKLQSVHSKSELDLRNVESVFAAFEMAKLLNIFPSANEDLISQQIDALKLLIVKTLENSIEFHLNSSGLVIPKPYGEFLKLVKYLQVESKRKYSVSVFTFNYDILLDLACMREGIKIDYGLDNEKKGLPILKLHGSTNWGYCKKCKSVIPYDISGYIFNDYEITGNKVRSLRYITLSNRFNEFIHCEKVDPIPVIVPPTWNKSDYHKQIATVWKRAAHELQDAEHIFIIGYSLPPTDMFFRFLYALGTVGQNPLKSFCVYDPAKEKVSNRFKDILGLGVKDIYECNNFKFSDAIPSIKEKFPPER